MKGVGGPLLCIGDLLSDVGEGDVGNQPNLQTPFSPSAPSSSSSSNPLLNLQPSDLIKLVQLCTALETANKLVLSTNSHVGLLSENLGELEKAMKRGDSTVAAAKTIHRVLNP